MNLGEFIYSLVHANEPFEFIAHWNNYEEITNDYKLIVSCDNYNKSVVYPPGLADLIYQNETDIIPYFMNEKIFALDTEILKSMVNNSSVPILFDHSIMLDTNYTSYIKNFLESFNQPNLLEESTYKTLDILLRNNFNYDIIFYLLENYMNLFASGNELFTISNPNHLAVYENLYYVELFKSINQYKYISHSKIEFTISENEAKQKTDYLISLFYSRSSKEMLRMFIDKHQYLTLLLIGIWQIQFSSKASAKNKMKKLFEFVINKVGIFYEREMVIAYRYFEDSKSVSMLNKINKGKNSITQEKLFEKVSNITWDFMVPRVMEFQINANKQNANFIPLFLSHDKKLKELISLFNIKGVLLHKETNEYVPFSDLDTTEFFTERGLYKELELLKSENILAKRKKVREEHIESNFSSMFEEIKILQEILEK